MSRDYAKGHGKKPFPLIPVLTGVAIGCGLALIGTVLLTPLPENEQRLIQNGDVDLVAEEAAKDKARAKATPSLPPEQPARFKFYELLPNLEIIPFVDPTPGPDQQSTSRPRNDTASRPRPAPTGVSEPATTAPAETANSNERYWIQAGSFRNAEDAEAQRVHLILLGFAPKVEKASIPGKGTFHRIKIGPLSTSAKARAAMQRLAEDGVDSYVQREKLN